MSSILRASPPARPGVILLPIGPLASWVAEFITAVARQQPPTPPLNNWVSHPGRSPMQDGPAGWRASGGDCDEYHALRA